MFIKYIRRIIQNIGFDIVRYENTRATPFDSIDISEKDDYILSLVKEYTMTSSDRVLSLIEAMNYIVSNKIDGDVVECGVWKGGSCMTIALALLDLDIKDREIFLYDTFLGMTKPLEIDMSTTGEIAVDIYSNLKVSGDVSNWCYSPLEEVKQNVYSTGYPVEKFHFIKGNVEDTIPKNIPGKISLLRLDTDWYESTKHELTHLFPLLSDKGVIIIDDYGYWNGCRKAVDEYFTQNGIDIFLHRIGNGGGRIGIKILK